MPTGYTQRFKGKIKAQRIDLGSGGLVIMSTVTGSTYTLTPTELSMLDGGGVPGITATTLNTVAATPIAANGITIIPDTTANSTYYLADPIPGMNKVLVMTSTVTSSGTRSVASLTTGVGIYGSSMGTVRFDTLNFGSSKTIAAAIDLLGLSSTAWIIVGGAYNPSTVTNSTTMITLSTRT